MRSNDLVTHHAFKASYNDNYFLLATNYALVASLNIAIYTEQHIQGYIGEGTVKVQAQVLANNLENMYNAAESYVRSNVVHKGCHMDEDNYEILCEAYNKINGIWLGQSYDFGEHDDFDEVVARYEVEYFNSLVGDVRDTIIKLKNL